MVTALTYAELVTRPKALRIVFGVAVLVQFWALYVPKAPGVQTGLPLDKLVHFALFAVATWIGLRAGIPARWLVPLMILQAASSELVQHFFLPQRGGDWWDFLADLTGIAIGFWLGRRANRQTGSLSAPVAR